jgi:RNA polymerase sigma factor (sigma-70 family)
VTRGATPRRRVGPRPERSAPVSKETAEVATGNLSERVVRRVLRRKERLLAFLEERLGSRADAEDLLQTAMVRLVEKGRSLRAEDRVLRWFYRVLRNLLVDWHRRRAARARMMARVERLEAGGRDEALHDEVCACVRDVLGTLRREYAEILRRAEIEEQPLVDIARDLCITRNNASVRLHRARRALLEGLRATCGACFDHGCLDCYCRKPARGDRGPPVATG